MTTDNALLITLTAVLSSILIVQWVRNRKKRKAALRTNFYRKAALLCPAIRAAQELGELDALMFHISRAFTNTEMKVPEFKKSIDEIKQHIRLKALILSGEFDAAETLIRQMEGDEILKSVSL